MVTAETAKRLLGVHGEVRSQPHLDWTGSFPIPPAVEQFYVEVGPFNVTIETHGNPYFLPSLADLWQFQAGYRWNGLSGEPIEDWPDDWLVVADEGGDPFIVVRSSGVVLHAFHGEGEWDAGEIFPNLNTMACLTSIAKLVQPLLFHGQIIDLFLITLTFGVVGILPVWFVLATKWPTIFSIGVVTVGACVGYCLGLGYSGTETLTMTVTATEALSVVVSLLVVRSCGYRLVRLPR